MRRTGVYELNALEWDKQVWEGVRHKGAKKRAEVGERGVAAQKHLSYITHITHLTYLESLRECERVWVSLRV